MAAPDTARPLLRFDAKELIGRYYLGDGLGVNCTLTLSADRRFTFRWSGCLGEYDRNQGGWELAGDIVVASPEGPNRQEGFKGMNVRFVPIQWGRRIYLIDENETPGFCAAAGKGDRTPLDGIHGQDYVQWNGDDLPPRSGKPMVPARYQEFVDKGPVTARVVRHLPEGRVLLNKGGLDRLKVGMLLAIDAFDRKELKIVTVEPHVATAQPRYFWNSGDRVKVGEVFTTGAYWHRPGGTGYPRFASPPQRKR